MRYFSSFDIIFFMFTTVKKKLKTLILFVWFKEFLEHLSLFSYLSYKIIARLYMLVKNFYFYSWYSPSCPALGASCAPPGESWRRVGTARGGGAGGASPQGRVCPRRRASCWPALPPPPPSSPLCCWCVRGTFAPLEGVKYHSFD